MKYKNLYFIENEVEKIAKLLRTNHSDWHLNQSDLMSIVTYRKLIYASEKVRTKCHKISTFLMLLFGFILVVFFCKSFQRSISYNIGSSCLIPLPNSLQNAFVPLNRCDFCRNISFINKEVSLSQDEFLLKYAYNKVPVVVADAMVNWTASRVFSFEYFKQIYNQKGDLSRAKKNCQFFPYKTEFHSLHEAFSMDSSRANYSNGSKPWYIGWSNCDYYVTNQLRKHYQKPYFLPNDSESIRTDWIFMGTPNYGAHMHIDHVGRPSWQAQIRGRKRWFLEPPLECYGECDDHIVDVDTGDIIVLDTNVWYHRTLIVGEQVSITIGAEYD